MARPRMLSDDQPCKIFLDVCALSNGKRRLKDTSQRLHILLPLLMRAENLQACHRGSTVRRQTRQVAGLKCSIPDDPTVHPRAFGLTILLYELRVAHAPG